MNIHRISFRTVSCLVLLAVGLHCMAQAPEKPNDPPPKGDDAVAARPAPHGKPRPFPSGGVHLNPGNWGWGDVLIQTMAKLKKDNAEEYKRLEMLRRQDKQAFFKEISKYLTERPKVREHMRQMQECLELCRDYRRARTDEERNAIHAEIEVKARESFESMLKDAHARLDMLQKNLAEMEENKDAIIEEGIKVLTDKSFPLPDMRWRKGGPAEEPPQPPPPPPAD